MADDSTQSTEERQGTGGAGRHRGPAAPAEETTSAPHGRHRREAHEG
ncbi:hypothetical protein HHL19_03505 [Streptomyces sp. R302]|nr:MULTISPECIES: hypothetical protein [unclassified Streptomyces]NML49415.1 hypothetical protein [Streptomyces sp. R301]NML77742.1 hypothetical protein [Streptomyces sp. R302]